MLAAQDAPGRDKNDPGGRVRRLAQQLQGEARGRARDDKFGGVPDDRVPDVQQSGIRGQVRSRDLHGLAHDVRHSSCGGDHPPAAGGSPDDGGAGGFRRRERRLLVGSVGLLRTIHGGSSQPPFGSKFGPIFSLLLLLSLLSFLVE